VSDRLLVSVITPTWQRPDLLRECIGDVWLQTYRPIEHVLVVDGFDPDTLAEYGAAYPIRPDDCGLKLVVLSRNWSSFLVSSFCAAPITVGMLMASGDYQMWLADDERMQADHIELLVDAIESNDVDFAYSSVELYWPGQPGRRVTIGSYPPAFGQITNVLYRTSLLRLGLYPFGAGMASDWACIKRWLDAGARCVHVPRVTLTHRVDH
jgi:glycosyltransferase involved in cell wall biosynthesis